jgi:SAM-dependent methyltransferase
MQNAERDHEHWARIAAQWIAWARAPNHDAFWAYRNSLIDFIGRGEGEALDVGCGEGRVSRVLRECGYRVTAADPVEQFVLAAEQADSADHYKVAAASDLPFMDCSFDLVVAYNILMDIEDIPAALREIKRVLRSSGALLISIVHPFADRGRFASHEPDAPFVLETSYFGRERFEGIEERDGLRMHFAGWSQPSKTTRRRWRVRGWRSRRFANPFPTSAKLGPICGAGKEFLCSSGLKRDHSRHDPWRAKLRAVLHRWRGIAQMWRSSSSRIARHELRSNPTGCRAT